MKKCINVHKKGKKMNGKKITENMAVDKETVNPDLAIPEILVRKPTDDDSVVWEDPETAGKEVFVQDDEDVGVQERVIP